MSQGGAAGHTRGMKNELTRNVNNKKIAGIIAGIQAAYLPHMDLTLLRVLVALVAAFIAPLSPIIVTAYLVLWVLLPESPRAELLR